MIDESFWRSEPAAAFLGFGASFWPSSATRSFSSRKPEIGMYTSPRTSATGGGPLPRMRRGTEEIVRRLTVTSSPWRPSPRVAPRVRRPPSYVRLIASPSIFGSVTNATGSSESSRLRTSSAHFWSASSVVTFSSEPIGVRC